MGHGQPVFRFQDVSLHLGDVTVLDGLNLEIRDRLVTVIAGPSGAGKSTVLRLCNRLEVPSSGVVEYRGKDVGTMDPLSLRRRVGMVFQRPTLFGGTVRDNLAVAERATDSRYESVLERVGLSPAFLGRHGDDLSGGEAQRACLARTLLTNPQVLLMDEPTSSLDLAATRLLERLALGLAHDGVAVLWVSHDLEQVRRIADERVVIIAGCLADPPVAARYLGGHDPEAGAAASASEADLAVERTNTENGDDEC
jgi:putative ABC transport system ATP-binding protein